ncbi:MAG: bifunctional metallophosphatase/5'-nucleotidase [Nitrospirae bacterium]|nr:bifunctional metallophosphatase/5'-nucleotidase [Nitrospirota bacterium]
MSAGQTVGKRPVGGAAVLASYLKAAEQGIEDKTIIVHAGDHVGASPPVSALLKDEPTIMFMNTLANKYCVQLSGDPRYTPESLRLSGDPRCNMAGTPGNHEFDKGMNEMRRMIFGGNHPDGPFLENPWRGALFPYVSSNVVDAKTGKPVMPPYVIKDVSGMRIAFIGAVLKDTPSMVTSSGVAGLKFLDEADSINKYIPELLTKHVEAVIALIHQGGYESSYQGATMTGKTVGGPITEIVSRLDDKVDVVISGHTHSFINALLKNRHGKEILVTQAFSYGTAYADIDLDIDRTTKTIIRKSASIVTTYDDAGPGLTPDASVSRLVAAAEAKVRPLISRVIGQAATDISSAQNSAGESALGNLIADAQRLAFGADFSFTNPGGIRSDIHEGIVTWGQLYTVQPFNNYLVRMKLTGRQIYDLLNQQWLNQSHPHMLQVSGLTYTWDETRPPSSRVVGIRRNGRPIKPAEEYTVVVNSFLADGGDNFKVLAAGTDRITGAVDLDALVAYIRKLPQPFSAHIDGRIKRIR